MKRPQSSTASAASLANQAVSLAVSVPFVVGTRIARAAVMGQSPSAADRREFNLMFSEKAAAAMESSWSMMWSLLQSQQRMWLASWGLWSGPWTAAAFHKTLGQAGQSALMHAMDHGLRPYTRKAAANAARLRRVSRQR